MFLLFIIHVLLFRILYKVAYSNLVAGTFLKGAESALKLEEQRSQIYKEVAAEAEALRRNMRKSNRTHHTSSNQQIHDPVQQFLRRR